MLLTLKINNKIIQLTRVYLFIGFIVAFSGVALYQLPYALENVNAISPDPIKPGASELSPGSLFKNPVT